MVVVVSQARRGVRHCVDNAVVLVVDDRPILPDFCKCVFPSVRVLLLVLCHEIGWRLWGSLQVVIGASIDWLLFCSDLLFWNESSDWLWLLFLVVSGVINRLIFELLEVVSVRVCVNLSLWSNEVLLVLRKLRHVTV